MTAQEGIGPGRRILDRYEIVRHIATGGMGTVWEARDLVLDQTVALKHVSFASLPGPDAEQTRQRTLREARFAAQLRGHHHVVAIYDVQEVDGDVWLVLEYLPSHSLADLTDQGTTLPIAETARIGAAVADALAAAHERGITHRDVKPGNVLLSLDGREVKLTDFGISHAEGEHPLTALDVVSGTPAYMSREVARGDEETSASDVFSLGATLYKAVEGHPPFGQDSNSRRMLQRVANGHIEPPRRAGPFTPLLMHLLELDPNTRPDAAHATRLLDDFARRHRDPTHPPTAWTPPTPAPYPGPVSQPSTHIPNQAGWTPPPVRPHRRRNTLLAIGAVVLVLALVAGAVIFTVDRFVNRTDPTAIPPLPATTPQVTVTDFTAANPCALFDPARMARYGTVTVGPGVDIGECRLTNTPPGNGPRLLTEAHYSTATSDLVKTPGPDQDLGGMKIGRVGMNSLGCSTVVRLSGDAQLRIDTRTPDQKDFTPRLCDINGDAIAIAVDRLTTGGVTYDPRWHGRVGLARDNACLLPGDDLSQVPGLDATTRVGTPNGAYCNIGADKPNAPHMVVGLLLEPDGDVSGYGTAGTAGGKTIYTAMATATNANSQACDVYIVHRPSYDKGASGPAELIDITVEGPQTYEQSCQQATKVAVAAEGRAAT